MSWLFTDQDYGFKDFYAGLDTVVMGRKTYDVAVPLGESAFAGTKNLVVTRNPALIGSSKTVQYCDLNTAINMITRSESTRSVWMVGGGELAAEFFNRGLIHELVIAIHPVILAGGIPLFTNITKEIPLRLTRSESFSSGLVMLRYSVF